VPVVTAADVSREFEPNAPAVSQARRFLRQALQDLLGDDDGSELADTLLMAANELTTNAVLHARTEFVVRIAVDAVHVRVEVTDGNSRVPQPCVAPADATSGRGLAIIDGSGLQHGIDRHPGGKTVWVQAQRGSN
jgi:anti-sigma regulatory factor (Ser/Thr protein kinase)